VFDFEYGRIAATVGTKSSVLDASNSRDDSKSVNNSNNVAAGREKTRTIADTLATVRLQEYQRRLLTTEDDYV
jgi:hypothetical protein